MTRVVNIKTEPCDVYIGRGSIWGNPFRSGVDGSRAEVIEKYRLYLTYHPEITSQIEILRGKTLGCHCKPKACHGDVLLDLLRTSDLGELLG